MRRLAVWASASDILLMRVAAWASIVGLAYVAARAL
jgi:hypothetical protein